MRKNLCKSHRIDTSNRFNITMRQSCDQAGFSLLELLVVMAIASLLMTVAVFNFRGSRSAGARQGTADVVMLTVEQARQTAIVTGAKTYIGLADTHHPDPSKRLRAYILFRDYTEEEIAEMNGVIPSAGQYKAITKWEYLPKGFYFDPGNADSILQDASAQLSTLDLGVAKNAGQDVTLYVIAFDPLGQVVEKPSVKTPRIVVTEGIYLEETGTMMRPPNTESSGFFIEVSRLTGRVQFKDNVASTQGTGN